MSDTSFFIVGLIIGAILGFGAYEEFLRRFKRRPKKESFAPLMVNTDEGDNGS